MIPEKVFHQILALGEAWRPYSSSNPKPSSLGIVTAFTSSGDGNPGSALEEGSLAWLASGSNGGSDAGQRGGIVKGDHSATILDA